MEVAIITNIRTVVANKHAHTFFACREVKSSSFDRFDNDSNYWTRFDKGMAEFFSKLTKGLDSSNKKKKASNGKNVSQPSQFRNPFVAKNSSKKYGGEARSLGGSKPGVVMHISLPEAGLIGVKVEKRPNSEGSAIVSQIVPGSQGEAAGLQRGDIICHANSDGEEEITYDQFLAMAASSNRPLKFDIRRITSQQINNSDEDISADAYSKRQAVIAAAEARDKAHKARSRPISKGGAEKNSSFISIAEKRRMDEEAARLNETDGNTMSDEARRAVEAAKQSEAAHAAELGYNPYETSKMGAGTAKGVVVAKNHGAFDFGNKDGGTGQKTPATGKRETNAPESAADESYERIDDVFDDAFTTLVTTNTDSTVLLQSIGTMRKLILNATTKGQQQTLGGEEESFSKFRRVRLSNPKIAAAITEVHGALDLMMSVGFLLVEEDEGSETFLVYPPGDSGPEWLGKALSRLEQYETQSS